MSYTRGIVKGKEEATIIIPVVCGRREKKRSRKRRRFILLCFIRISIAVLSIYVFLSVASHFDKKSESELEYSKKMMGNDDNIFKGKTQDQDQGSVVGVSTQQQSTFSAKIIEKKPTSSSSSFWANDIKADTKKLAEVKEAMQECFNAYKTYALGHDELMPRSKRGSDDFGSIGATLIDSLDTLYIMGLKNEFAEALGYLKGPESAIKNLFGDENQRDVSVSVFETNIRIIGGLLSTYDLSGDKETLELAETVAAHLMPAFDTPTGIPHSLVNVKTGISSGQRWTNGASILADFGTLHLEWATLSERTGNPVYAAHTEHVFDTLASLARRGENGIVKGLFPHLFNVDTGKFSGGRNAFGGLGDSFYEYLIKCWRSLGDLKDAQIWRVMFDDAIDGMKRSLLREWRKDTATGDVYAYLSDMLSNNGERSMEHLACFAPGMLVLGAAEAPTKALADEYVQIAKNIARTCVEMYSSQPCGISPDQVMFNHETGTISVINAINVQRPETVESLFYLYRKTGDDVYRTQAWTIFQSMKKAYRVPESGGWEGVRDVRNKTPLISGDDKMQSFFLAETLKYLYLIFASGDAMHLNEWVFNTEAHPFRITKKSSD